MPPRAYRASRSVAGWFADRDWLLALSLAFAVGVGVWFARSVKDFFAPAAASVLVPSGIGQTENDAIAEIGRLGLKPVVVARRVSERYPKNVVIDQQPVGGTRVRAGRQVSLIVSKGVNIFPMPDLRGESLRNANLAFSRLRLQLAKTQVVPNDEFAANTVISQDPVPLSSVHEGVAVSLTLSRGPQNNVRVPDFIGMSIDEARDEAAHARIRLGQVVWTPFGPSGPARGRVVRQAPEGRAEIDPFAPVSLQVSAGPHEYGYLIRQVHATARVPNDDSFAAKNVRVEVRDDTGVWNVYDAFAQPGQRLDFTLTVVGTASIDTYVNNELLNQTSLGREPEPHPSPSAKP